MQTPRNKYFVLSPLDLRIVTFESSGDKSPQIIIDSRSAQLNSRLAKLKSEECIFAYYGSIPREWYLLENHSSKGAACKRNGILTAELLNLLSVK
jgi:hypothetical protein